MANLLEYVGCVHIYLGPYRGNPIALYLKRTETGCQISPKAYPWNDVLGVGETPNKAAADFEDKNNGQNHPVTAASTAAESAVPPWAHHQTILCPW